MLRAVLRWIGRLIGGLMVLAVMWIGFDVGMSVYSDRRIEHLGRKLGGPDAVNCGAVGAWHPGRSALDCGLRRLAEAKPFFVLVHYRGTDSSLVGVAARDKDGRSWKVHYDSSPAGGGASWTFGPAVSVQACASLALGEIPPEVPGGPYRRYIDCVPAGAPEKVSPQAFWLD